MIHVVAGVLRDEQGRVLLAQRPAGKHLAGMWEFPGGKIDPGETDPGALERELREELDVHIEVGERMFRTRHTYPDRTVDLSFYRCNLRSDPQPQLGQEMRWVPRAELASLGLPPADTEFIALLTRAENR
jgi:8-oxo-dGTP diphosphatase